MESHEVLKQAVEGIGVKAVAARLRLSPALVYKWCQPSGDIERSGALNPLDRLAEVLHATGDVEVVNWLCRQAGGFFALNPQVSNRNLGQDLLQGTQQLVKEFSDMLNEVSAAVANDGEIEPSEAARIRRHWETLKRVSETFVVSSERGHFYSQGRSAARQPP